MDTGLMKTALATAFPGDDVTFFFSSPFTQKSEEAIDALLDMNRHGLVRIPTAQVFALNVCLGLQSWGAAGEQASVRVMLLPGFQWEQLSDLMSACCDSILL